MTDQVDAPGNGRRNFLKNAAAAAGAVGAAPGAFAAGAAGRPQGAENTWPSGAAARLIPRPGSDFMVDVIKSLGLRYVLYLSCHGRPGWQARRRPQAGAHPFPFVAFEMQLRTPRGVMPRYVASIPAGPKAAQIPLLKGE
jgi:hypothetical protein